MSGFGYVRDQKPNVVDWANVGREMGKTLELEFDDRRKRKDDINQQDRDFAKELLDQPQGSYAEANRFISDFSTQASQQALNDLKLLKTGEISEREYYKRRANLTSGTDIMFLAGQKFNENYESAMKSIQDGSSSVLLADLKSKMEGYTNFANHGTYINPLTGTVNVSSLDENGVVSSLKGNFMDASELLKLSTADFKNFELDKRINNVVKGLGKLTYRGEDGTTKSVSMFDYNLLEETEQDKFKREMQTALTLEVDSIVGGIDSKTAASILADHSGGTYNLVFNGEYDKDGKLIASSINENNQIAYDVNGNIQLTDAQLKKAKDLVQRRLQQGLDASILEKPKTSELEQARIDAYNRSNQIDEDDAEDTYKEFISNQNINFDEKGNAVVSKEVLRKLDESAIELENQPTTRETLKSMFDNNLAFPGYKTTDIKVDFGERDYEQELETQNVGSLYGPESGKPIVFDKNIKYSILEVPKLMDNPINIPLNPEENQKFIVNFYDALDKARRAKRKLNKDDYIKIFGSEELFNLYNPLKTESISTGDQLFKK